jgi:hypothetical protein
MPIDHNLISDIKSVLEALEGNRDNDKLANLIRKLRGHKFIYPIVGQSSEGPPIKDLLNANSRTLIIQKFRETLVKGYFEIIQWKNLGF